VRKGRLRVKGERVKGGREGEKGKEGGREREGGLGWDGQGERRGGGYGHSLSEGGGKWGTEILSFPHISNHLGA